MMGSKPVGISASRGAAILGLSDYRTPVEAWLTLMEERAPGFCAAHGYVAPVREESAPMRWGTAFEDVICSIIASRVKGDISDREGFYQAPGADFVTCHIDGRYPDGNLHEGKTTSEMAYRIKWGEPGTQRIPSDYAVQVQHQLLCTGAPLCTVSVLVFPRTVDGYEDLGWRVHPIDPDENPPEGITLRHLADLQRLEWGFVLEEMGYFHQYPVSANAKTQRDTLEAYRAFWNDHVLAETPPPVEGYGDIKALFPEPVGTLVAPQQVAEWAREYKDITKEIGASGRLGKRKEELKTLILDWARGQKGYALDEESQEKIVIRDGAGRKLAQYDGRSYR